MGGLYILFNNIKKVRTEINTLLSAGLKPEVVAVILDISLDSVYYNNRQLKKGDLKLGQLDLETIKARIEKAQAKG